jgi:hypothetical protein
MEGHRAIGTEDFIAWSNTPEDASRRPHDNEQHFEPPEGVMVRNCDSLLRMKFQNRLFCDAPTTRARYLPDAFFGMIKLTVIRGSRFFAPAATRPPGEKLQVGVCRPPLCGGVIVFVAADDIVVLPALATSRASW